MKQFFRNGFLESLINKKQNLELKNKPIASEGQIISKNSVKSKIFSYENSSH